MIETGTSRNGARASIGKGTHQAGRLWEASDAFLRLGWRQAISYPLGFFMS